jgi:kynurenine formamidase
MKIIDLSLPICDGMPVYPGDPEVKIKQVHTLAKQGWNLRTLFINTHLATHINVPSHMMESGESLNDLSLDNFCGPAIVYGGHNSVKSELGIIFRDQNIDEQIARLLIKIKPKFVGLAVKHEFEIKIEKKLLEAGIISYENLVNTEKLPSDKQFMFSGFPLKIKDSDGSPVRAVAVI